MHKQSYFLLSLCLILLLPGVLHAEQIPGEDESAKAIDLPLSLAVKQALQNNLNLKLRREDVAFAEGGVQSGEGEFDTLLSAEAGAGNKDVIPMFAGAPTEEDRAGLSGNLQKKFITGTEVNLGWNNNRFATDADNSLIDPAYTTRFSLGFSQPLLKGWGTDIQGAEIEAAQKQLEASVFLVNSQAADLAALVKNAYWDMVFALQDIEVQRLSLALAKKLLEETKFKIEAGKLAEIEIYQPQSEVARREEKLIIAERAIGVAEDELKLLLNSEDWITPLNPTDTPQTNPVHLAQERILGNALTNRPDIKAADLNIQAAKIQATVAKDNIRPSLAMAGSLGYGGTDDAYDDALSNALDEPETEWTVGLNFSVPLHNSFAKGRLMQAKAVHRKAKTDAQLLRLRVKKSVRTTVRDVKLAIKAMEATRKTSLATSKRLEAEQAKFEAGSSTTLDVLIAQDAYSQALSQENRTSIVYAKALAEIDRIQGLVTIKNDSSQ